MVKRNGTGIWDRVGFSNKKDDDGLKTETLERTQRLPRRRTGLQQGTTFQDTLRIILTPQGRKYPERPNPRTLFTESTSVRPGRSEREGRELSNNQDTRPTGLNEEGVPVGPV